MFMGVIDDVSRLAADQSANVDHISYDDNSADEQSQSMAGNTPQSQLRIQ